jgi:hypothetical protein
MQYIYRVQVIILFVISSANLFAQRYNNANVNYNNFKDRQYYFGITLGYNSSNYKILRSEAFLTNDDLSRVESLSGGGLNIGLVTNLKIGEYFDIRLLPTLSFANRQINYKTSSDEVRVFDRKMDPVFVEAPLQFRYKSDTYKDMKMYVLGGVKYIFDVSSESRTKRDQNLVKIAPSDFAFEVGVGAQFYFPYFIFSPEIKFSQGISNTLIYNRNISQSTILDRVLSRTFTLSFHFEG